MAKMRNLGRVCGASHDVQIERRLEKIELLRWDEQGTDDKAPRNILPDQRVRAAIAFCEAVGDDLGWRRLPHFPPIIHLLHSRPRTPDAQRAPGFAKRLHRFAALMQPALRGIDSTHEV